jgi:AcrR family transcriptional regulator
VKDTRERILAEATRQILRDGYAACSVASVRDALGLSSGSMFHAFPSKPALAAAVYVEGMAGYQRVACAAMRRHGEVEQALRRFIATHLAWIEDHRELARFLFATLPDEVAAEASKPLEQHNLAFFAGEAALFERATRAGLMAELPRPLAHALCIGPSQEYGRLWTRGEVGARPRRVTRLLQDAALAALASTASQRERPMRKGKR